MGDKHFERKEFLQTILGRNFTDVDAAGARADSDPLFHKYARKELGPRIYDPSTEAKTGTRGGPQDRAGNVTSGLLPYTGPWQMDQVLHLLRRTCFGARIPDALALSSMTMSAAVDNITTITNLPGNPSATPLNNYSSTPDTSGVAPGSSWTSSNLNYINSADNTTNSQREQSLQAWSWGLMLNGDSSIREKMVQFWYHFIPINFADIRAMVSNSATLSHQYMKYLRDNALGNFNSLIRGIAIQPAMLVYLSNHYSTATAPNENFARELMELFMLGKSPTQNYVEADIKAAARVLSGWKVTSSSFKAAFPLSVGFDSSKHNTTGPKLFSSFFGNTTIANAGANEFNTLFDLLLQYQSTTIAKHICRRLYRFFVYYDIDANVETNVIVPLAASLISNNWEMLPVMRQLLKSQHFYDMANRGVMIKSPFDFICNLISTLNINTTVPPGANQLINQYSIWRRFQLQAQNNMEQGYGLVPDVSGWKAYYQGPAYFQNWINSNTIQQRANFITSLFNGFTVNGVQVKLDPIATVQQLPNSTISNPDLLVATMAQYLLPMPQDPAYLDQLKTQSLLAGQANNSYWQSAWANYIATPSNTAYKTIVTSRLGSLLSTLVQLAEHQLV